MLIFICKSFTFDNQQFTILFIQNQINLLKILTMINIVGIIGNESDQYSLVKLISDVKKEPENQPLHLVITSPGGDGELAFDMFDYLRTIGRIIITESKIQCASAASILFLAGDRRIAGCPIMIHNPWTSVEGDSDKLNSASKWMGDFEKRCEKFYAEKTGLDEKTISDLMKNETYLSPTESVSLKFATESRQPAMALVNPKQKNINNKNFTKMAKEKKELSKFQKILAILKDEDFEKNMMDLTTADGSIIVVDREEGEPEVGDSAAPDGTHVMPNGTTIVIENGVIIEIIAASIDEVEEMKTKIADLQKQLEDAISMKKTVEESAQLNAIKIAGGTSWLEKQCSHYRPQSRIAGKKETAIEAKESNVNKKLAELREKKLQTINKN